MSNILDRIKRGSQNLPPRILLSGPEGIGKSTFGASFPNPIFIAAEEGLTGLDHVAHISPNDLEDIYDSIAELTANPQGFQTIVVDTTDWLERMIYEFVCRRDKKEDIEAYGYGKGYVVAEQELVKTLSRFDRLRSEQKMGIVLLSHVEIKPFTSPDGTTWDRYSLKGNKKMTGILREWPDACLFAVYEVFKMKEKGQLKEKTIAGDRVIRTNWSPAWDAKNRLGLPDVIPLDYDTFAAEVLKNSPVELRKQFLALLETSTLDDETKKAWVKTPIDQVAPDRIRSGITKLKALQPR